MKNKDSQQIAYEKTISDFWDTSDVPQESLPVKIAPYPSLESLNEEPKDKLTEADHEYYDKKRKILLCICCALNHQSIETPLASVETHHRSVATQQDAMKWTALFI